MSSVSSVDNLLATFRSLPIFVALNIIALFTHLIFALLSLLFLCKNPFSLLRLSLPPYLVGFATTSTIVPLPKCYDVCDTYGIPKPISRFVLPIAGTMKKDASAVFIVAAVFYVAQASNVTLHLDQAVIVIILTTAYVTAMPNIPSASVIVAITILNSICADPRPISLLYALEWLNNRLRSGNTILSHTFCTAFLYHMCEEDLKKRKEGGEVLETAEETHSTAF